MATTTFNGVTVPAGTDLYNLAPDIKTAFESAGVIVEAANSTARDAIAAAAIAAGGGTLTRSLYVHRLDTNIVEATDNGTTWYPLRTPVEIDGSSVNTSWIKTGKKSLTTNSSGDASITFPTAFPNGLLSVQLTEATASSFLGPLILKWTEAYSSKSAITMRIYDSNGTALASVGPVLVSYLAIGY